MAVVGLVGYFWSRVLRDSAAIDLKREMIERGLSAAEIALVVEAGREPDWVERKVEVLWANAQLRMARRR